MYYKFRNFNNYKYIIDIVLNQRLYASSFRNLNDNFEGQFFSDVFQKDQRIRLNPIKKEHISVCSFSDKYESHLMWSHYTDGHRGFVIGFEVPESKYIIEKVVYNGLSSFSELPHKFHDLKKVFLNKLKEWSYEEEYRIIVERQDFIRIVIKEVIFGAETMEEDQLLITKLVQLVDPNIKIDTYS